jgi:hypothetical protein
VAFLRVPGESDSNLNLDTMHFDSDISVVILSHYRQILVQTYFSLTANRNFSGK